MLLSHSVQTCSRCRQFHAPCNISIYLTINLLILELGSLIVHHWLNWICHTIAYKLGRTLHSLNFVVLIWVTTISQLCAWLRYLNWLSSKHITIDWNVLKYMTYTTSSHGWISPIMHFVPFPLLAQAFRRCFSVTILLHSFLHQARLCSTTFTHLIFLTTLLKSYPLISHLLLRFVVSILLTIIWTRCLWVLQRW